MLVNGKSKGGIPDWTLAVFIGLPLAIWLLSAIYNTFEILLG